MLTDRVTANISSMWILLQINNEEYWQLLIDKNLASAKSFVKNQQYSKESNGRVNFCFF